MKTALIVDVAGGDGAYLARLLQARGYAVWGSAPDLAGDFAALDDLGVRETLTLRRLAFDDAAALAALLAEARPAEIYDLTGAGGRSPEAIVAANAMLLDLLPVSVRLFSAGSSAAFGDSDGDAVDESTPMRPDSAAGQAAASSAAAVRAARAGGRFAVTGLQFDHASRFGPEHGLAQHIIEQVLAVAAGTADAVFLSTPDLPRDWGWTPEYVDAMWRMLQAAEPRDYVLATGTAMTPREFADHAFDYFAVTARSVIASAEPARHNVGIGNPALALRDLGWRAYTSGQDLVQTLCEGYAALRR